jgi:PAS domain S-box-containing protein
VNEFDVLEFLPDAVVVADPQGSIRYANRMLKDLLGYEPAEVVGTPLIALMPARFRPAHRQEQGTYFAAPRVRPMALGANLTALHKDGREVPVDISLAPLRVGPETYAIAAIRDTTERRQFEERKRQLSLAREEIRHRDEVLAIASHELRSPVGAMQLQATLVQRAARAALVELRTIGDRMRLATDELNAMAERTAATERQAQRLARLVDQLLDSAHVKKGALPLRIEETDLAAVARDAVEILRTEVERSGSALTLRTQPEVRGEWDPVRIEQVIGNLLLNAAKFGLGKPISVTVEGDAERARVIVADHGTGIAPADHERIFEQFERAVAAGGALGLGLGLYISRQIVLAHGGALRLRSSVGQGSTFTVDLPRARRASA